VIKGENNTFSSLSFTIKSVLSLKKNQLGNLYLCFILGTLIFSVHFFRSYFDFVSRNVFMRLKNDYTLISGWTVPKTMWYDDTSR